MDREKVIKALELCVTDYLTQDNCKICPYGNGYDTGYCWVEMNTDALALLKEQDDLGTELTNAVELIHKKNERIEKLLKERETATLYKCPNCGTWVSAENVVRCKDCKHRGKWTRGDFSYVEFPERSNCPCQCEDFFYSWRPDDDWFCANGERTI